MNINKLLLVFDNIEPGNYKLKPVSNSGRNIRFIIESLSNNNILPTEKITFLAVSQSYYLNNPNNGEDVSIHYQNLLKNSNIKNDSLGMYSFSYTNGNYKVSSNTINFDNMFITINEKFQNTRFYLFWKQEVGTQEVFNKDIISEIYSNAKTITYNDITISAKIASNFIGSNLTMKYTLKLADFPNNSLNHYSDKSYKPYAINITTILPYVTNQPASVYRTGGWIEKNNGQFIAVNNFDKLYITREELQQEYHIHIPYYRNNSEYLGMYNLRIQNVGINGIHTDFKVIGLNHNNFSTALNDGILNNNINQNLVKKDEILIPQDRFKFRNRLSIGIQDIAIIKNNYKKNGVFISRYYDMDNNIFNFSLDVKEFIPKYDNLIEYSIIRYYVEFGNNEWLPISPIHRDIEIHDNIILPKSIVFDIKPLNAKEEDEILYLEHTNIRSFRIKIVFDVTSLKEQYFIPPEIKEYRCIVKEKGIF